MPVSSGGSVRGFDNVRQRIFRRRLREPRDTRARPGERYLFRAKNVQEARERENGATPPTHLDAKHRAMMHKEKLSCGKDCESAYWTFVAREGLLNVAVPSVSSSRRYQLWQS